MQKPSKQAVPTGDELAHMLSPISVETFIAEYADRKALLIKGSPDKFKGLGFDQEDFLHSAERFDPGANRLKAAVPSDGEQENYVPILPMQVRSLFHSGLTVCAAGLSDVNPRLGAFAEGVRYALSIPDLRFNAYLSPDASGFNLHYDAQPIFLIQIAGAKRWWYGAEPVSPLPRVYSSAWERKPDLDALEQTTLEPGDVLYLPAFTWHRARARGFSLGITLGTKGVHNKVIRGVLEQSPFFDDWPVEGLEPPIDAATVNADEVPPAARAYLEKQRDALRRFASELTIEQMWSQWVNEVQKPKGPRPPRREVEVYRTMTLRPARRFPAYLVEDRSASGEPSITVRCGGRKAEFSAASEPLVRWLLSVDDAFSVSDATDRGAGMNLTRAEVKRILRELLAITVLEPDAEVT